MRELTPTESLYIQLLQDNISRMNHNCMQCKTWCVALVTGLLTVVATTSEINLLFAGMTIVLGAYILDCSYLRLEKNFRCFEKRLVDKIKSGNKEDENTIKDYLFDFDKNKLKTKKTRWISRKIYDEAPEVFANRLHWRDALFSWSTILVYPIMLIILIVTYYIIKTPNPQCCCGCC